MEPVELLTINTLRVISAEAVEKAKSGHPGLPMGSAAMAYTLWAKHLKQNPKNPKWIDRDRFVLSAGHGCMLLYTLLHLFGFDLTMDDIKNFRQFGSRTPGHPEYGHTDGVEATTGPLGQGIGNAVGMAIAEEYLAARFNRPGFDVINHRTYAIVSDGDLMEGVSSEACSLAGSLALGKLIFLYDSNKISIEGSTDLAFREDSGLRFESYGWHVIHVEDGNDTAAVNAAIEAAKAETTKPSIIVSKNIIGYGSPGKHGTASAHGEALGVDELAAVKEFLGWTYEPFEIPKEVLDHTKALAEKGAEYENEWDQAFLSYRAAYPELADEFDEWFHGDPTEKILAIEDYWNFEKPMATRESSGITINRLVKAVPNLIGGSADLAPSNKTNMTARGDFSAEDRTGANLHFGVREHSMAAVSNGIALHGGLRNFAGTFLIFTDYMKAAMRLSAIMKLPVVYVLTHDSIGLGEDGPTHEPIEHLAALRSVPNMTVFRPADARETAAGWLLGATKKGGPVALILTRQSLPNLAGTGIAALKGAYILRDSVNAVPDILLIASGSEVSITLAAAERLVELGVDARVVSFPSFQLFEMQPEEYKESVLPDAVTARVVVEAASSFGWHKYAGRHGGFVTIDHFGASGKGAEVMAAFGFTADNIVAKAKEQIAFQKGRTNG